MLRDAEPVLTKFARDHPDVAVAKIDATKRMNERLADATARTRIRLRFRRSGSVAASSTTTEREMKRDFARWLLVYKAGHREAQKIRHQGIGEAHFIQTARRLPADGAL